MEMSVPNRRHRRRRGIAFASATYLMATGAAGLLLTGSESAAAGPLDAPPLAAVDLNRAAGNKVSRDFDRTSLPAFALPSATPSTLLSTVLSAEPSTPQAGPPPPTVAGLDEAQTGNAALIVAVAQRRQLPLRAMVVAIATALQESDLRNVASTAVPESMGYPHQGVEVDHDSVGLFQQRPSQGWGTVAQLMDPQYSTGLFLDALARVPGWESMSVASAAQAVQRSAYPNAYAQHETRAAQAVAALLQA
jgi:hypothetical protein